MSNWGANHSASSYGHIGADLITLASILRIPVCMHNVEEYRYSGQVHGTLSGWIKEGSGLRGMSDIRGFV